MAEKKESKGSRRYGHGPKIVDDKVMDEGVKKTTPTEHGDTGPEATEAAGTIRTDPHERKTEEVKAERSQAVDAEGNAGEHPGPRHVKEMKEMHDRHHAEMGDMHERHEAEHKKLAKRHGEELAAHHGGETEEKKAA